MRKLLCLYYGLGVFAVCTVSPTTASGQSAKLDSLWQRYHSSKEAAQQLKLLNEISWAYIWINPEETVRYAEEMLCIADEVGIHTEDAAALNYLGVGHYIKGENTLALASYAAANEKAVELNDSITIASVINNRALLYAKLGLYDKALAGFTEGAEIAKRIHNDQDYSMALCNTGSMLEKMGEYEKAIPYYREAVSVASKIQYNAAAIALCYLGRVHDKLEKPDSALYFYEEAVRASEQLNDQLGLANIYLELAELNQRRGSPGVAVSYLNQSEQLAQTLQYSELIDKIICARARVYLSIKQYKQAIDLSNQVVDRLKAAQNNLLLHDFYEILSSSYADLGNYESAYFYQKEMESLDNELFNAEKIKAIKSSETRFQIEKQAVETQLLREKQKGSEIKIAQRNEQIVTAVVILLLSLIITFIIYQNYLSQKYDSEILEQTVTERTNELQESNKNLERFAHIASHDLKEPLRNITSFVQLLNKKIHKMGIKDEDVAIYVGFIESGTRQMKTLIDDVLAFTTVNKDEIAPVPMDLSQLIEQVKISLKKRIEESGAMISYSNLPTIHAVPALLFVVFKNLIENGIKYNQSSPPRIQISCTTESEYHLIAIKDNGIGIEYAYQEQVFEMFARLHNRDQYEGSGLGLAICQKAIQQLDGKLWVESDGVNGSTFLIRIPNRPVPVPTKEAANLSPIETTM